MSVLLFKDCTDVWNRLFDHRPFLKGEINYFIKEFEEKRQNQEETRLLSSSESLLNIQEHLVKVHNYSEFFKKIPTLLSTALQNCETILDSEDNFQSELDIETKRATHLTKWESHLSEMEKKYSNLDSALAEREKELQEFYEDLENKLKIKT